MDFWRILKGSSKSKNNNNNNQNINISSSPNNNNNNNNKTPSPTLNKLSTSQSQSTLINQLTPLSSSFNNNNNNKNNIEQSSLSSLNVSPNLSSSNTTPSTTPLNVSGNSIGGGSRNSLTLENLTLDLPVLPDIIMFHILEFLWEYKWFKDINLRFQLKHRMELGLVCWRWFDRSQRIFNRSVELAAIPTGRLIECQQHLNRRYCMMQSVSRLYVDVRTFNPLPLGSTMDNRFVLYRWFQSIFTNLNTIVIGTQTVATGAMQLGPLPTLVLSNRVKQKTSLMDKTSMIIPFINGTITSKIEENSARSIKAICIDNVNITIDIDSSLPTDGLPLIGVFKTLRSLTMTNCHYATLMKMLPLTPALRELVVGLIYEDEWIEQVHPDHPPPLPNHVPSQLVPYEQIFMNLPAKLTTFSLSFTNNIDIDARQAFAWLNMATPRLQKLILSLNEYVLDNIAGFYSFIDQNNSITNLANLNVPVLPPLLPLLRTKTDITRWTLTISQESVPPETPTLPILLNNHIHTLNLTIVGPSVDAAAQIIQPLVLSRPTNLVTFSLSTSNLRIDNAFTILICDLLEVCQHSIEAFSINSLRISKRKTDYEKISLPILDRLFKTILACPMMFNMSIKGIYLKQSHVDVYHPEMSTRFMVDIYHKTLNIQKISDIQSYNH